ncbi:MAG TPA: hypothetical protein VHY19_00895 [Steroidobacteraceae bacterium]|jgi:hypothetical protein|nr:hypothetical protein [Steroidobacteraceae bacterium]
MAALHRKNLGCLRLSGVGSGTCRSLIAILVLSWSGATLAQSGPDAASASAPDVLIRSSVPGAKPTAEPGANSVPDWAEQSYKDYLEMKAKANGGKVYPQAVVARMPDWSGIWTHTGGRTWDGAAISREAQRGGTDTARSMLADCQSYPCKGWLLAALTPQYELLLREKLAAVAHDIEWDPDTVCIPPGFPRTMIEPFGREFVDMPQETWTIGFVNNDIRRIYTDGRGHVSQDNSFPTFDGDSIGFWDGDTLVVHTLYMRGGELQRDLPSLSQEVSTVERIRMTDPNTIIDDATIYDPLALREPWHGVQKFARMTQRHNAMNAFNCDVNIYETPEGKTAFLIPGESEKITIHYQDLSDEQNYGLDRVYASGAKILKEQQATPKKP